MWRGMLTAPKPPLLSWVAGREVRSQRKRWEMVADTCPDLYDAGSTQYDRRREITLVRRYRTGLIFAPGVVRLAGLFLHVRGIPGERIPRAAARPFELAKIRWRWAHR